MEASKQMFEADVMQSVLMSQAWTVDTGIVKKQSGNTGMSLRELTRPRVIRARSMTMKLESIPESDEE